MSDKRVEHDKIEAYTRALLGAARGQDRANLDLVQLLHARKFTPEVLATLAHMERSDDLKLIGDIAQRYKEYIDAQDPTVSVSVTTAVALDDKSRATIKQSLENKLKCPIYMVEHIDPSIIGGIIVEERGKRYDVSVRAQLANMRKTLSSTFIGGEDNE